MLSKIWKSIPSGKTWHLIALLSSLIIIMNISFLFGILKLFGAFILFLFNDPGAAFSQFNLALADHFISLILIVLIPLFTILKRNNNFLQRRLNFSSSVVIILGVIFIFAPLITDFHPDFQKDLKVTKLLPPISSIKIIHLQNSKIKNGKLFFEMRNKIIKESFNENIIFADSIKMADELIYYQKEKENRINKFKLIISNEIPRIETKTFLLGTDEFGRDVFTRLIYGTRISLFVGLGAVFITLLLGLTLGFIAGYAGGITDSIISRITDMLLAFPIIFLIILILALFGNSLFTIILILGYSGWMSLFKIVRGEVISIKQKEYFISAKLSGLSGKSLLLKEIFPVILAPVVVNLVFQYGNVILAESALSYLGLGTGSLYPSWGSMIESGQEYLTQAWWMIFFPGLALFITLYTANSLGKELNLFFNPRLTND